MKHRRLIIVLFWLAATPLAVDAGLRMFDPWGAMRYVSDGKIIYGHFVPGPPGGYALAPGNYQFSGWSATINPDGTRRVVDTNAYAACTLVFLGDSVTFGHGVSDNETWVSLLARHFPGTHMIDAGVNAYNIENVVAAHATFSSASAYIYLLIDNDDEVQVGYRAHGGDPVAILTYLYVANAPARDLPLLPPGRFETLLKTLIADPRVAVVAFDTSGLSRQVLNEYPAARRIPLFTHRNSRADPHANAEGNREIAAAMLPIVRSLTDEHCRPVI